MTQDPIAIGPISEGTLRTEDLIEAFANHLSDILGDAAAECAILGEAVSWLAAPDDDTGDELLSDLADEIQAHAPPYMIFGANEGDGACFGWWPAIESAEEDAHAVPGDADVIKCHAGSEPNFCLSVNDHGNVSLYRITYTPIWETV